MPSAHGDEGIKSKPILLSALLFAGCEALGSICTEIAEGLEGYLAMVVHGVALCCFAAGFFAAWHEMVEGKIAVKIWALYGCVCIGLALIAYLVWCPVRLIQKPSEWQPPELPKNCKDVVIWFGGQGMIYPMQSLTNYPWGPEKTSVPIASLPSSVRTNLPNMPGFSPRQKDIFGILAVSNIVNGKADIFYPVVPQVVSNRLYVFVKIPFTNYQQIVIGDQMDYGMSNCLPQSPDFWDWNYSRDPKTNVFEIVDANKNPIVQVIYKSPREVLVNGVFFVGFNDFQATFGGALPAYCSFPNIKTNLPAKLLDVVRTNQFGGTFPTNAPTFGKHLLPIYEIQFGNTNLMGYLAGEDIYSAIATNQKPIFKYPSNVYPGEFAK